MTESTKNYRALQLHHPAQLVDEMIHSLKCMAQAGCSGFDCAAENLQVISRWGKSSDDVQKPALGKPVTGRETLKEIRTDLGDCRRCKLCDSRNSIVFGQGAENTRLVFVGEGPGAEEDRQGLAFVGAAGQLLTKIIQSIKMTREEVYICNIIKCRPPGNRNPQPDEISGGVTHDAQDSRSRRRSGFQASGALPDRSRGVRGHAPPWRGQPPRYSCRW